MPRRKYKARVTEPDRQYQSVNVAKLINVIMKDGKKRTAEKVVYSAMSQIADKKMEPVEILDKAIDKAGPNMIVRPRRIGGASYMVPKEISGKHRVFLGIKWLVESATARSNKEYHTFAEKLAAELLDAADGKGAAVEKKEQAHKLAEANKVFAHFAW